METDTISIVLPRTSDVLSLKGFLQGLDTETLHKDNIEVCVGLDDDKLIDEIDRMNADIRFNIVYYVGPDQGREDTLKALSNNSILMMASDDLRFKRRDDKSWDRVVIDTYEKFYDRMVVMYGDDGLGGQGVPSYHFVHRRWIERLPFWCPPDLGRQFVNRWQTDIADKVHRKIYVESLYIDKQQADVGEDSGLERLYSAKEDERNEHANILKEHIYY